MRFLIDNNLSIGLPEALAGFGHEAIHVRSIGLGAATDSHILGIAGAESRIIISGDRDFGTLLARLRATQPSVVYLRGQLPRLPGPLAILLHRNLTPLQRVLEEGCIVVIEPGRVRIRRLPIE